MLSETWWKKCVLIWEFLKTKTMMECVYLPLKGGCFLCLNKTLRSPPTAVSFINIMVVGMRIAAAQTPSHPWAQPWIDLLCWWDERRGFHPVTLQMNLLEASCGRKSIYRLLTHSSCCQKLSTAFEATLPSLLPRPPCSDRMFKNWSLPQGFRDFWVFFFFDIRLLTWRILLPVQYLC